MKSKPTPEQMRIAIAKFCKWSIHHGGKYVSFRGAGLLDPLTDLNVMALAESKLRRGYQRGAYWQTLGNLCAKMKDNNDYFDTWKLTTASAARRAEAFYTVITTP